MWPADGPIMQCLLDYTGLHVLYDILLSGGLLLNVCHHAHDKLDDILHKMTDLPG